MGGGGGGVGGVLYEELGFLLTAFGGRGRVLG